jgi:hypothetical protein
MLQAAKLSLVTRVSDKNITDFLKTEQKKVQQLAEEFAFDGSNIIMNIPLSKPTVLQKLGLENDFSEEICCPECFKLYPIPQIPKKKGEKITELTTTFRTVFYSESKKFLKKVGPEVQFCNTKLMDVEKTGDEIMKIIPTQTFTFQTLKAWLTHKLWLPGFEALLDSNLKHENPSNGRMDDVWDGSVWKNLVGPQDSDETFTSKPGHLVFSLYVDWFNPYGNKSGGKSVSLGAVALVCLNLPLAERYKIENIYLFGVIPGPKEPKVDQMNNILEPLVKEMLDFWKGVWFTKTIGFPKGRLIFAAIFPLIGDLPAIRKTAGFASHAATRFCSLCEITIHQSDVIGINKFEPKTHEAHMERVKRWEEATDHATREDIATKEGARSSILNKLPYWRPVEHCGIEIMHVLLLGNLKDHSSTFLKTPEAGKDLKALAILEGKWKKKHVCGGDIFQGLKFPDQKRKKTPDDDGSSTDEEGMGGRKRRLLSSKNLSRLSRIEEDAAGPSTQMPSGSQVTSRTRSSTRSESASRISVDSSTSRSTVRRYDLRARSVLSTSSRGTGTVIEEDVEEAKSADNREQIEEEPGITTETEGDHTDEPRMVKEELRVLQDVITQTQIPTWVSRVPHNFGLSGSGSLKAADWLILYTVYYPLAMVPYWVIGSDWQKKIIDGSRAVTHQDVLRDSLVKLIEITNILMKHHLEPSDITRYSQLILEYRQTLQLGWPTQNSKPNLHLSEHYPEVIKRLGPPMATSAWAQERLNGMLGKIPRNNHLGR